MEHQRAAMRLKQETTTTTARGGDFGLDINLRGLHLSVRRKLGVSPGPRQPAVD